MDGLLPFVIAGGAVSAVIGYLIGNTKGRGPAGAVWGFVLGPLGWLLVLGGDDTRKKCPLCRGPLETLAVARCRHCGGDLRMSKMREARPPVDPIAAWEESEGLKRENLRPLQRAVREPQRLDPLEVLDDPPKMTPLRRAEMRKRLGADD